MACDPALGSCFAPVLDAGPTACGPSQLGGPCLTAADCILGLACVGSDAGPGSCQPFSAFVGGFDCIGAGELCGSSIVPCCAGACVGGLCSGAWGTCFSEVGSACSADTDCCTGSQLACISGSCQVQGMLYVGQPCQSDSDCSPALGYLCLSGACNTRLALPGGKMVLDAGSCVSTACEASDAGLPQCVLGSICRQAPGEASGEPSALLQDPCNAAGLYCDALNPSTNLGICIAPQENAPCVVGGPACAGLVNSTESHLACVEINSDSTQLFNDCEQPCEKPADCLDPFSTCEQRGISANETTCNWPYGFDDAGQYGLLTCASIASPCDIPGQEGGGTCVLLQVQGNAFIHLCYQGDPAGTAGTPCITFSSTRQAGGLCASGLFCNQINQCTEACDTTGIGPGCDAGTCQAVPADWSLPGLGLCE